VLAFLIAGHHAGLADRATLGDRLKRKALLLGDALAGAPPREILESSLPTLPVWVARDPASRRRLEMWIRMLFSTLCDADFLDTEAFYSHSRAALREVLTPPGALAARLREHVDARERSAPDTEVNRVRREVRACCLAQGQLAPGFFTLTVPTGGGKTFASMSFALEHAERHGLRRVVVAIPFTSIIEQSALAYRKAFGDLADSVLEHHSALDPRTETPWNRVACENWDSPVVVTTTVQLFESLFARRTSRCRKLHSLAKSVIVLDEAQTVPVHLLATILDGLKTLVRDFGASVVVCTATQPALGRSDHLPGGLEGVREIVPETVRAFDRLRRVEVRWPAGSRQTSYEALADEVAREEDVLVIVHKRTDAREVTRLVDMRLGNDSTFHLSALMCADHRSAVLAEIKARKARKESVRLISTQLVEAGVDLDFPVVYRALAGVDALAQAAGRCNREGLRERGELRVFRAPTDPPQGVLRTALGITEGLLNERQQDLFDTSLYVRYFRQLYGARDLDERRIQEDREALRFETVAKNFQMIEDDWSAPLVVPYGDAPRLLANLEARAEPDRFVLRALQRFTVVVPRMLRERWMEQGYATWVKETVVALVPLYAGAYTQRFGLETGCVGAGDVGAFVVDG
jgi:CRISPR-associated endonuclease/helicase Cas3